MKERKLNRKKEGGEIKLRPFTPPHQSERLLSTLIVHNLPSSADVIPSFFCYLLTRFGERGQDQDVL